MDFLVAASNRPISGSKEILFCIINSCCNSHELKCAMNHGIEITNPISLIWLYKTARRAAVFASVQPYHHLIRRKDITPTPSQPMKS